MNAQLSERQELAVEVLRLAKDRLLVSSPFLAPAASLLPFVPSPNALSPLSGTDAKAFYFNANHVLACFAATHEAPVHDYVHTLLHCLFLHPFAKHARYFRDALVRAQYRNAAAKIFPDDSFLMRFYKNVIGEDGGELNRMEMICARLFEDPSLLRNIDPKDALRKA